jgi:hypothetical protein
MTIVLQPRLLAATSSPVGRLGRRFGDARGWFTETWNAATLAAAGLDLDFVQDNHSLSAPRHTLRGLHYQRPPHAQDKLVRCGRGAVATWRWTSAADRRPSGAGWRGTVGGKRAAAAGAQGVPARLRHPRARHRGAVQVHRFLRPRLRRRRALGRPGPRHRLAADGASRSCRPRMPPPPDARLRQPLRLGRAARMKLLVTGGAGFIGSAVVRLAIARGHQVVNLDALTYAACLDNVASVAGSIPAMPSSRPTSATAPRWTASLADHAPDAVMHLAAESHVDRSHRRAGRLHRHQCHRHLSPAGGRARILGGARPARGLPLPPHLDGRGVRVPRPRPGGEVHRRHPLRPAQPLFGLQGGLRPSGARLA